MRRITDIVPIVGVFLLLALFVWGFVFGDGGRDIRGKTDAQVLCKNEVREATSFPAMARFRGAINVADDDARYLVSGTVLLMNEAGTMIPHAFVCDFHKRSKKTMLLSLAEQRAD